MPIAAKSEVGTPKLFYQDRAGLGTFSYESYPSRLSVILLNLGTIFGPNTQSKSLKGGAFKG